jgi:hypothetical protein
MTAHTITVVGLSLSILTIIFLFVHETPYYLFSKRKFKKLRECLSAISKINMGEDHSEEHIDSIMIDLTQVADISDAGIGEECKWTDLIQNKTHLKNIVAVMGFWAIFSFSYYLVGFFIKYFPGNIFVNFAMFGLADICASFNIRASLSKMNIKQIYRIYLVCLSVISFMFYLFVDNHGIKDGIIVPVLLLFMRLYVYSCFNISYYSNTALFPTLLRSKVFSTTNSFCRPFTMLAPMVVEYTQIPSVILLVLALLA